MTFNIPKTQCLHCMSEIHVVRDNYYCYQFIITLDLYYYAEYQLLICAFAGLIVLLMVYRYVIVIIVLMQVM